MSASYSSMGSGPTPSPIGSSGVPQSGSTRRFIRQLLDLVTYLAALAGAISMIILLLITFVVLVVGAWPAIVKFNWHFLVSSQFNPVTDNYGCLPMLYGTFLSSFLGLLVAVPVSLGAAIFIVKIAPFWIARPCSFLIELLAAIPSLAFGLWGVLVMSPWLQLHGEPWLHAAIGWMNIIPVGKYHNGQTEFFPSNLVQGAAYGSGMLAAGLILAIMIIPIITAISRDVLAAAPPEIEQGAYGLGATWWQAMWVNLGFCKTGLLGAVILGMARAVGETMAVTMVIGNTKIISASLFSSSATMASVLANEFTEADTPMYTHALVYLALVLLVSTMILNSLARFMVARVSGSSGR
ncbi:MAG TPA: phosphate ABC transporter permease subunit PstC [Phycisphaerae bacterium]|nr:phosphate ABC transporter permease subunit PstC [Phycisphaerae bacterium]